MTSPRIMTGTPNQSGGGGHTPGPWQVNGSHIYGREPDRTLAAQVLSAGARHIADRRLIAAAPELLAHLEFAVKLLRPFGHTAQVQAMEAVVRKARGHVSDPMCSESSETCCTESERTSAGQSANGRPA